MRWNAATALAALVLSLVACGGGPLLQNVPRPNPAAVAGIAAAVAAAATVVDPAGAARLQEAKTPKEGERSVGNRETMPPELLDRLDEADARAAKAPDPAADRN